MKVSLGEEGLSGVVVLMRLDWFSQDSSTIYTVRRTAVVLEISGQLC